MPLLTAHNLHKRYNGIHAVRGISFEIAEGEIYSLLGPNGAGKTTTIGMLTTLLAPTEGEAEIGGFSVTRQPHKVKEIIGVVPQEIALYDDLTAAENLRFWGRMYGLRGNALQKRVAEALDLAQLTERADDKVGTYSGGMQRRLNIAVGLLNRPQILFLDEPTVGIDPQSRRRILDTVLELNRQGLAVLYTTHYMEEAQELSHRIGIIDQGQLIAEGTLEELIRTTDVRESVVLSLDAPPEDPAALCAALEALPGVEKAASPDANLILEVEAANAALPRLLPRLSALGHRVRRIELREPNLEAVFLHLTGRALRD
ncbi:MAG TPA: ABC transporter ATP-binding protein [Chloroflexi bacterium]|nr:ABC transporter ATP-binding protein [Chloroflexota bacterium]